MDKNLQSELKDYLNNDESLLWSGKPKQGIRLSINDAFIIPPILLWCVIVFHALFDISFILIGLYLFIGNFFFRVQRRKKIIYAITENRIIIKSGVFKESIESVNIKTLHDIIVDEKPDKSGTIIWGGANGFLGIFREKDLPASGYQTPTTIETIDNARIIYQKIIKLREK